MSTMNSPEINFESPVVCPLQTVEEGWIDYNGHMNMAYYNVAFDRALDHIYDLLGVGEQYVAAGAGSFFTMEVHVNYIRELVRGDPIRVHFQLLDHDAKRLHFFQHMYHAEQDYLAATSEQLALHVDLEVRRAAPVANEVMARLKRLHDAHADLPRPELAGRSIGIRRKP